MSVQTSIKSPGKLSIIALMKDSIIGRVKQLQLLIASRLLGKKPLHFIHIGKTAGTAIHVALHKNKFAGKYSIILHNHDTTLRQIPDTEKVFFVLRDPVARYVSGFNTRLRGGRPRNNTPHSAAEKIAFVYFDTPNKLAVALSAEDSVTRERAEQAMKGIGHVNTSYWDWFESEALLYSRASDIMFVGFQERLTEDFERLKTALNLPKHVALPTSDIDTHRTPSGMSKTLEPLAVENLQRWYAQDYQFIEQCKRLMDEIAIA